MTDTALIDTGVFAELQAATGADFVVELVDTFAEELPGMLGELRAALEVASADRFRRAAHSLKTNALSFGAQALGEQAKALEVGGLPADVAVLDTLHTLADQSLATLQALTRG